MTVGHDDRVTTTAPGSDDPQRRGRTLRRKPGQSFVGGRTVATKRPLAFCAMGPTNPPAPTPPAPAPSTPISSAPIPSTGRADDDADRFDPRPVPPRPFGSVSPPTGDDPLSGAAYQRGGTTSPRSRLQSLRRNRPNASSTQKSAKPWPRWMPWVVLVLLLGVALLPRLASNGTRDTFDYSTFLTRATAGDVADITFTNGTGHIAGHLADGTVFRTSGPDTLSSTDLAMLRGVNVRFRHAGRNAVADLLGAVLPLALLILFLVWMSRRSQAQVGGIMSIGKTKAKAWSAEQSTTRFADVAGYEGVKGEIAEVVDFLRHPERFREIGATIPRGILLVGPPGTGKTLLARAVAGEAGVSFLSATGSDFMEMFVGVGASRVRDLFDTARRQAPCIMFIDEIDSIGRKRGAGLGGGHDEREQTLNQMLSEMDGFEPSAGVVVLAATNRPDVLDPALLRPGRFDRQIVVPLPDLDERIPILRVHCADKRLAPEVDLPTIARSTPGMSGADLANLVNEAALAAVRRGADMIGTRDFETARDRIVMGQTRESLVLSDSERATTAFHEAGHAVLAHVLEHADPVHKVTIIPRGMALGVTMQLPVEDRHSYSEAFVLDRICVAMGGRCAEKLVYGHLTTGASNDLVTSTELARRMVREWGMSDRLGPMAWGGGNQVFLGEDLLQTRDYADATSRLIDEEVAAVLRSQETRAAGLLIEHRVGLDAVANELLERETIDGRDVARLVDGSISLP